MILSCYLLSLTNGKSAFDKQRYFTKSLNLVNGEQFIINTRERIKNKQYVPSALYVMVSTESEINPLTCMLLFGLPFDDERICDQEMTDHIAAESDMAFSGSETPCINVYEIIEQIRRLRYLLTVHSGLYYDHGVNIISDADWDAKALHLVTLQKQFPSLLKGVDFHDDIFSDFTGDTGMHLPWREPGMAEKIYSLGKQWGVL